MREKKCELANSEFPFLLLHGCQMAIANFYIIGVWPFGLEGLWLRYARMQNLIPFFPCIAPPRPPPWHNPRKGIDQILPSGNTVSPPPTESVSEKRRPSKEVWTCNNYVTAAAGTTKSTLSEREREFREQSSLL